MEWLAPARAILDAQASKGQFLSEQRELSAEELQLIAWRNKGGAMGFCPPEVKRLLTRDQYASFLTDASEAQYRKNVLGKKVLYIEEVVPRLWLHMRKGEVHHQRKYVECCATVLQNSVSSEQTEHHQINISVGKMHSTGLFGVPHRSWIPSMRHSCIRSLMRKNGKRKFPGGSHWT